MLSIGLDPHQHSHVAVAVDQREQWPERRWAVKRARGRATTLAQQLVVAGDQVATSPQAGHQVRLLDRGHGRKTDQAHARSVAPVTLRTHPDPGRRRRRPPTVLRLRADVATSSTRNAGG